MVCMYVNFCTNNAFLWIFRGQFSTPWTELFHSYDIFLDWRHGGKSIWSQFDVFCLSVCQSVSSFAYFITTVTTWVLSAIDLGEEQRFVRTCQPHTNWTASCHSSHAIKSQGTAEKETKTFIRRSLSFTISHSTCRRGNSRQRRRRITENKVSTGGWRAHGVFSKDTVCFYLCDFWLFLWKDHV